MNFNINNLKNIALSHKAKFEKLSVKIRKLNSQKADKLFHDLHHKEFKKIDCLKCANCCKTLGPRLKDADIEKLSKHLKIKPSEFFSKYLKIDDDNDYVFQSMPCPFLAGDNFCLVYNSRPKACKEYPHTNQKNILGILNVCLKNTQICPIVFLIFKKLETELQINKK